MVTGDGEEVTLGADGNLGLGTDVLVGCVGVGTAVDAPVIVDDGVVDVVDVVDDAADAADDFIVDVEEGVTEVEAVTEVLSF